MMLGKLFLSASSIALLFTGCATAPHQADVGETAMDWKQIPAVLQTILDYDESGGRVPFNTGFSSLGHAHPPASLLKSVQPAKVDGPYRVETWSVDVAGQVKAFTVLCAYVPGGSLSGPDWCTVRYPGLVEPEAKSFKDDRAEVGRRITQDEARAAYEIYAEPRYSYSYKLGMMMKKAFAYSPGGAWGAAQSGPQESARYNALWNCEARRQSWQAKCVVINVDGKWTRDLK